MDADEEGLQIGMNREMMRELRRPTIDVDNRKQLHELIWSDSRTVREISMTCARNDLSGRGIKIILLK